MLSLAAVIFTMICGPAFPASGQALLGDPDQGKVLAHEICSECHRVEKGNAVERLSRGPAFQTIARDPSTTGLSLRVFLRTPHRDMPDVILTETESDNVIAYILSLR